MREKSTMNLLSELLASGWDVHFLNVDDEGDHSVLLRLVKDSSIYAGFFRNTEVEAIHAAHHWNEQQITKHMGHSG